MKHASLILFVFCTLWYSGFKKVATHQTAQQANLETKMMDFKQLLWAQSIVKIERPEGALYWFKDIMVNGGEPVFNDQCELVCMADYESDGKVLLCDGSQLDFPTETIWHK